MGVCGGVWEGGVCDGGGVGMCKGGVCAGGWFVGWCVGWCVGGWW